MTEGGHSGKRSPLTASSETNSNTPSSCIITVCVCFCQTTGWRDWKTHWCKVLNKHRKRSGQHFLVEENGLGRKETLLFEQALEPVSEAGCQGAMPPGICALELPPCPLKLGRLWPSANSPPHHTLVYPYSVPWDPGQVTWLPLPWFLLLQ